jgi:PleD family two-component response regulator
MHGQKGYDILVIDDDGISRNIFQKHLIKAGFNVASAPDGRQALDRFDDHFFPIVITDWMMPKIDGPMLCQLIREKRTEGYVYIIMITAKDTKTDVVSGLKSGADDYLTKPIHPGELIARVHSGIRILNLESSLKKAKEDIRWLTITDPLTACFNRGYLKDQLPKEMRHAIAASLPLSLIMADIDFFKHVNDTYGHQAGDEIIKVFSGCIQQQLRKKVDWMVRYGGEEFLIVENNNPRCINHG